MIRTLPISRTRQLSWPERLRSTFMAISSEEVGFGRRGFPDDVPGIRTHLERAGGAFVDGYNAAVLTPDVARLVDNLDLADADLHGFVHEGAAMALALLDVLSPWRPARWRELLDARGNRHLYLILVGAGWAMARFRLRHPPRFACNADPVLWPLLWDGYGFHQGFFHAAQWVRRQAVPPLRGYALRAFDQGLGRSLWFVEGASPTRIAATIATFAGARRADLWSGVGLACGYAGGADAAHVTLLAEAAGPRNCGTFAQGVVFAATARVRAGNVIPATELACSIVCGVEAAAAAAVAREDLDAVASAAEPRYEAWRRRIARRFSA